METVHSLSIAAEESGWRGIIIPGVSPLTVSGGRQAAELIAAAAGIGQRAVCSMHFKPGSDTCF